MKTTTELQIDESLSRPAPLTKSTIMAGLIAAAWEAKQRGENTITLITDTTAVPCKCCNPPVEL